MPDPINGRPVTPRNTAMAVASSALKAQQSRMRIIAENIANAESTANVAGGQPYRRQTPVFQARNVDGATGVVLAEVRPDQSDFRMDYDPSHPAANAEGYVQRPNVDTLVEAMDMREAQRAYEANLNVIETARNMDSRTLDIIKK
ncbi:flagellar basal body rod protein FlgC [Brevundimonas sp. 3P9-tot-E]|jgi:flagellar basal-body rod protein FlgC|uniref:Flagellar basal-body rod protein FlgC n=3 Tax=Brevundimonas TaxID=41275 RepID=A0A2X1ARJ4_BREDI|nr:MULTISPECIES: flagellar basal body rod protein FlgC [Brevundimonas]MDA0743152.1 flagellar basal body rod protein FlgC [Pseudomonadota bacterium]EGF95447.1 flagellar basal-body rod protein FlgC [Brevundimonas diminuta ATCC 11568]MCZ4108183.1 flagellar basal body rod protein FlgC [Brevundimonas diminuta]MDM8354220.1 flagellar basal body rod protein FlgC [Brevundimonas diminuta]WQE45743.1 flagellar basal body rod protein FlgC [Brevundimonas diminuta]